MNEDKQLALSYMASFLEHIKALNSCYSIYSNSLVEIDTLFEGDFNLLNQEGKMQVINQRHAVVNQLNNTYLIFTAISENNPNHDKTKDSELADLVRLVNSTFFFKRTDLLEFIKYINWYIVKHNFSSLFNDRQSLVEGFR